MFLVLLVSIACSIFGLLLIIALIINCLFRRLLNSKEGFPMQPYFLLRRAFINYSYTMIIMMNQVWAILILPCFLCNSRFAAQQVYYLLDLLTHDNSLNA